MICVTDRRAAREDFLARIARLAALRPAGILLREPDLDQAAYAALALRCRDICVRFGTPLIVRRYVDVARSLGVDAVHLPLPELRRRAGKFDGFAAIEVSVHAPDEAREAVRLGANRLVAGHVFATGCKPGLPPRGLEFLAEVCRAVSVPVFAIGGIVPERTAEIERAGAAGVCIMSSAMTSADPARLIAAFAS